MLGNWDFLCIFPWYTIEIFQRYKTWMTPARSLDSLKAAVLWTPHSAESHRSQVPYQLLGVLRPEWKRHRRNSSAPSATQFSVFWESSVGKGGRPFGITYSKGLGSRDLAGFDRSWWEVLVGASKCFFSQLFCMWMYYLPSFLPLFPLRWCPELKVH